MVISLDDDVPTEIIAMDKDGGRLRGLATDKNQGSMVTYNGNYDLWGLDRINQDSLPFDDIYTYSQTGATVDVFVIDTGIRVTHQEFGGRARCGWSWKDYRQDCYDGDGTLQSLFILAFFKETVASQLYRLFHCYHRPWNSLRWHYWRCLDWCRKEGESYRCESIE